MPLMLRSGKGALGVSEELAPNQVSWDAAAIDRDKRAASRLARTINSAGKKLLPDAGLAFDQDRSAEHRHFACTFPGEVHYRAFTKAIPVPLLANITEFGKTPLFTVEELKEVGVRLVLYPLSAFRAMSATAVRVYETIRNKGTQRDLVDQMQTRSELYEVLNYHSFEQKLDQLFSKNKKV